MSASSDPKHTNVGCGILSWPPYLALYRDHPLALHLWWTLYIGRKAKTLLPGLWLGGVMAMADEANLTIGETNAAIATLTEHELIEHDQRQGGITRLTKLPDRCERAMNQNMLYGWWDRRQQLVPDCGVRDRHLELMAWLHLPFKPKRGRTKKGDDQTEMQRAWDETFGGALAVLRGGSVSTGGHGGSGTVLSGAQRAQLDLYSAPVQSNGSPNGSPNRPVPDKDQATDTAEGEVQEREGQVIPMAPAGLVVSAPELEDLGHHVLQDMAGPEAAKLWGASFTAQGENRIHLRAPAWVIKTYAHEIEQRLRQRTGLPISLAV